MSFGVFVIAVYVDSSLFLCLFVHGRFTSFRFNKAKIRHFPEGIQSHKTDTVKKAKKLTAHEGGRNAPVGRLLLCV